MRSIQPKIDIEEEDIFKVSSYGVTKVSGICTPSQILSGDDFNVKLKIFTESASLYTSPYDSRQINQFKFNSNIYQIVALNKENLKFIPSLHFNIGEEMDYLIPYCHYNKIL